MKEKENDEYDECGECDENKIWKAYGICDGKIDAVTGKENEK